MARVILTVLATLFAFGAGAQAEEFRYRDWAGARLPGDTANGCAMGLEVGRQGGFVIYGDAKRRFRIGLANREWSLEPGKEALAAVTFNDGPPILLKGAAVSSSTVLFDPLDFPGERGLEPLVEAARGVKLSYAGHYLRARLSGSARAVKLLWECVASPSADVSPQAAGPARGGEAADVAARAADFGFLRQGMAALDAHQKLIDAGWQAETDDAIPVGDDAAARSMRERGLPVSACSAQPRTCAVVYADAYANTLRATVATEGEPMLRNWRLNPPEQDEAGAEQ